MATSKLILLKLFKCEEDEHDIHGSMDTLLIDKRYGYSCSQIVALKLTFKLIFNPSWKARKEVFEFCL